MKFWHFIKSINSLVNLKRSFVGTFDYSHINVVDTFKTFAPNSAGSYRVRSKQTISTINDLPIVISELLQQNVKGNMHLSSVADFAQADSDGIDRGKLGELFLTFGSDKSSDHNYDLVYEKILGIPSTVKAILEIGLGTNNPKILSTMGSQGKPGASLRAFREYCPNAQIFGADIDRNILFNEERIQTFFVNQLDSMSFTELQRQLPSNFDLIIDDGLHSVDANMRTMTFALPLLRVGGWLVIEDISENSLEIWKMVSLLIPNNYSSILISAKNGFLFLVNRL